MNTGRPSLRIVRDDDGGRPHSTVPAPGACDPVATAHPVLQQFDDLQEQIKALEAELHMLRGRDETLRYYMQRVDEEMRLAARLQQDFLPKFLPQVGRVRFHTLFRPAGYVSGDLYDVMRLDETNVGFFICDAVGHGMPAALLTMFIKRALVNKEILGGGKGYRLLPPSETIARLNEALLEQNLSQATYATAFYGVVDAQSLEMRFAKGGHPSPALIHADGSIEFLEAEGALLGIFPDEVFAERRVQLKSGDRLFLYSDGVEVGFCNEPSVDIHHWQHALRELSHHPGQRLLEEFAGELDRQSGSLQPKDDVTIVLMEVK